MFLEVVNYGTSRRFCVRLSYHFEYRIENYLLVIFRLPENRMRYFFICGLAHIMLLLNACSLYFWPVLSILHDAFDSEYRVTLSLTERSDSR